MTNVNRRTVLVQMSVLAGAALLALATHPAPAAAQTAHADLVNAQGTTIGHAEFSTVSDGVKVSVTVSQLSPGEHGIHIHNVGKCDGPAFTTAGGHFNPTGAHHGTHNAQDVTLAVGSRAETVTVSASTQTLESESSDIGTSIQPLQVEALPLTVQGFRSLETLIALSPGVVSFG